MKRQYFNFTYAVIILFLVFLFIYFGFNFSENRTETMKWMSGKFQIDEKSRIVGIILILSMPLYFILRKVIIKSE